MSETPLQKGSPLSMSYQALYRKWRPDTFEDVKGQDHIVTTLKNQILADRIGHAYLFCGTRGTGKTSVAKIFARAVNCEHPVNGSPCGECPACKAIAAGTSMNVIEIDAASNNGVDNIREIREEVQYSPTEGKYKVYIIDEVHMLSQGAFNALLKTLEEPPEYIVIILITSNENKLLNTIKSRCLKLSFVNIDNKEMLEYIEKNQDIQKPSQSILDLSNGSIGRLIKINDNIEEYNQVDGITKDMINSNIRNVVKLINQYEVLYKSKEIIFDLLDYMIAIVYSHIKKNADYRSKFINIIGIINNAKTKLNSNTNYDMCIDEMLFKIWEEIDENNSRS